MLHLGKGHRLAIALFRLALATGLIGPACLAERAENIPAITRLSQLTRALHGESRIEAPLNLNATVFACDTNTGALIVEDASGVELLEIDGLRQDFPAGARVRLESSRCLIRPGGIGLYISAAPLLDADNVHGPVERSCDIALRAGRHPVRVDWFNQTGWAELAVACVPAHPTGPSLAPQPETAGLGNLIHSTRAEGYIGNWRFVPNFQSLPVVKTGDVTNFNISFRTRDELAGVRFHGYIDAPQTGLYHFSLRSDDGGLLWVGSPGITVKGIGAELAPNAPPAALGAVMGNLDERRLASVEGRVSFASRFGKGLRLELRSGPYAVSATVADALGTAPEDLLGADVRVSGVAAGVLLANQQVALGQLAAASARELTILDSAPGKGELPGVLTTALQVHTLTTNQAARNLPVRIRGVVTAVGVGLGRWIVLQDDTRGAFVRINEVSNSMPGVGEFWEVLGHTEPGDFAPIIWAEKAEFLGQGQLPEPARPSWDQLANGSLDVQWAELQGLVTGVHSNWLSLLLPDGRQEIRMTGWGESDLRPFLKAVVRVRGALFAHWNAATHEVEAGSIDLRNASVTVDTPAPRDPFDAPLKTSRGLFLFDAKATPFQRVKVRGQVTYVDAKRFFIECGAGLEVLPADKINVTVGDVVEAVGYPDLSGPAPLLREAIARKTGVRAPTEAPLISDSRWTKKDLVSTRARAQGVLAGEYREDDALVLHLQTGARLFVARVANADVSTSFRPGSKLAVTGVCVLPGNDPSRFELLVNSPRDIAVLSAPSWWTLRRLLSVVGALLATLALAAIWITLLRRQVAQRTLQLQREIREREHVERLRALETERSRIARDLHDDLGSSLTEINVLATTGQRPRARAASHPALFQAIADKARGLIAALDVIVWAVDPEDNSLQSLADYLSGYAREYLSNSSIACRFKVPVAVPEVKVDGDIRHELLMVVKETLNNIVRHAGASEVEFQMSVDADELEITIADNGRGFDPAGGLNGHGLRNGSARLEKVGGSCHVESSAGRGTTVCIRLALPAAAAREAANTTFV